MSLEFTLCYQLNYITLYTYISTNPVLLYINTQHILPMKNNHTIQNKSSRKMLDLYPLYIIYLRMF